MMFWNSYNSSGSRVAPTAVRTCIVALLLLWPMQRPAIGQQSRREQTKPKPPAAHAAAAAPAAAPVPFAIGETLDYQVLWSQYHVHAATLEFSVVEKRDFYGHPVWHFRLHARTINTMGDVYPLDDQFDSYTDAAQLASLQYEMYIHEIGTRETRIYRITTGAEPAPANATAVRVVLGTRDVVGFLYILRATDWQHTPEFHAPVFDGRNLYDVHARLEAANDIVQVPAGQLAATRVGVDLFQNGKVRQDTKFQVWFAHDAARTPLLIEAEVPIGIARIELLSLPKH